MKMILMSTTFATVLTGLPCAALAQATGFSSSNNKFSTSISSRDSIPPVVVQFSPFARGKVEMLEEDLSVDDGRNEPLAPLDEPPRAVGEVVGEGRERQGETVPVDEVQVGEGAGFDHSPPVETEQAGAIGRQPPYAQLEGDEPALANPVR